MQISNDLTDKQLNFIDVYFKEQDINQICKTLNISRPTYYKYISDDLIKAEISKIRYQQLEDTSNYLQSCLKVCSKELMQIIQSQDTSPTTKISAINCIFNNCNKMIEQVDILKQLDDINQRLNEQEQNNIN